MFLVMVIWVSCGGLSLELRLLVALFGSCTICFLVILSFYFMITVGGNIVLHVFWIPSNDRQAEALTNPKRQHDIDGGEYKNKTYLLATLPHILNV